MSSGIKEKGTCVETIWKLSFRKVIELTFGDDTYINTVYFQQKKKNKYSKFYSFSLS